MTAIHDTDPSCRTMAAAWASSPLGEPAHRAAYPFHDATTSVPTDPPAEQKSITVRTLLAAVLLGATFAAVVLGLVFLVHPKPATTHATIAAPAKAPERSITPPAAPIVQPSAAQTGPAPASVVNPNVVVSVPQSGPAPSSNPAPSLSTPVDGGQAPGEVAAVPADAPPDTTVSVDVQIPPLAPPQSDPPSKKSDPVPPKYLDPITLAPKAPVQSLTPTTIPQPKPKLTLERLGQQP